MADFYLEKMHIRFLLKTDQIFIWKNTDLTLNKKKKQENLQI